MTSATSISDFWASVTRKATRGSLSDGKVGKAFLYWVSLWVSLCFARKGTQLPKVLWDWEHQDQVSVLVNLGEP